VPLSQRTDSVERYLVSKNVPQFRISVVALGKENPVADNKTTAGRERNRRVEIKLLTASAFRQAN
jgi:OmpA-OmpF porin, OOP family